MRTRRLGRADTTALAGLMAVAVGVPALLVLAAGAVGIPSNDDWVYMRAASSLFHVGVIDIHGHTAAVLGQLVLVQPFLWLSGGDRWAFTAFGLLMTAVAVAATYLLSRRFVGVSGAVLVVALVVAFPGFARVSATFMTDVPAYAFAMLCLLFGTRWLEAAGGRTTLVASVVAGVIAVSIREFALAAPVAVLACAWARVRPVDRTFLGTVTILSMAGVLAAVALASTVLGQGRGAGSPDVAKLIFLSPAFTTLAAVLLPAIVLAVGPRISTFKAEQVALGAVLACLIATHPDGPLLGNLWTSSGATGDDVMNGTRDLVIGDVTWALSRQLSVLAGILLAVVAVRWGQAHVQRLSSLATARSALLQIARGDTGPLVVFLVAYAGGLVLYAPLSTVLDRYLYPLVPVAAILLLRRTSPVGVTRSHALAHGAVVWLAISAFIIAANSVAYDAARYREGVAAVALGYDARTVDAGYEWVGFNTTEPAVPGAVVHGWMWYDEFLASSQPCVVVSNSPSSDDAMRLIREDAGAYRQYLFFGPAQTLFMYAVATEGCPAQTSTGKIRAP